MKRKYLSPALERILSQVDDPETRKLIEAEYTRRNAEEKHALEKHMKVLHTAALAKLQVDFEVTLVFEPKMKVLARASHNKEGRVIRVDESRIKSPNMKNRITYEFARLLGWKVSGMQIDRKGGVVAYTSKILHSELKPKKHPAIIPNYIEHTYRCDCRIKFVAPNLHKRIVHGDTNIHCEKCNTTFKSTGETISFIPDIIIKRQGDSLVALNNFTKDKIAEGAVSVKHFLISCSDLFKNKKVVTL